VKSVHWVMFAWRAEDFSAQPRAQRAIPQPVPAFQLQESAHGTDGTAPTLGTAQDDITELCRCFMRLSIGAKQMHINDGHKTTACTSHNLQKPKASELVSQALSSVGPVRVPFQHESPVLRADQSQLSQELCTMQSALMSIMDPPTATNKAAADGPAERICPHPCPALPRKRKHCAGREHRRGSQAEESADELQQALRPKAKKICKALPIFPVTLPPEGLPSSSAHSNKQAQPSCAPAPGLAAKLQKTAGSCKTDGPSTAKEGIFQPASLLQKCAESEKPSGKRQKKTKHLEVQQSRKRSFLRMDDPFDAAGTCDVVTVPMKVVKLSEPTMHCSSSLAKPYLQKLHKQQQPSGLLE